MTEAAMTPEYSLTEIVALLERPQDAGSLSRTVEAFWPTIKAALVAYGQTHRERVIALPSSD